MKKSLVGDKVPFRFHEEVLKEIETINNCTAEFGIRACVYREQPRNHMVDVLFLQRVYRPHTPCTDNILPITAVM